MKKLVAATVLLLAASICISDSASAQQPGFGGFQPFGFYQPYGARYGNSVQTPPYFALNPPVYYGARYARPYGLSPFAAPPQVAAPSSYRGRLQTLFHQTSQAPVANPYICQSKTVKSGKVASKGEVQMNPFVPESALIAKN